MNLASSSAEIEVPAQFDPGSFRDRTSRVFYRHSEVWRGLNAAASAEWNAVFGKPFFQQALQDGTIIPTEEISDSSVVPAGAAGEFVTLLRHARIPFISYPYEWTFGMLRDAALLHLDILAKAVAADVTIKDGTAYNVQFQGCAPVFIDVASFERLNPRLPWAGYRQFCQTFLFPLMLRAYKNVAYQPWLRGAIDGIDPESCARLMSCRDWLRPGVFTHVYLHAKLQQRYSLAHGPQQQDLARWGFNKQMLSRNVAGLRKVVERLHWADSHSTWADYAQQNSYSPRDAQEKELFVERAVAERRWKLAWDLGCNTGTFSRIAARHADTVVAMDADHLAVERMYQMLRSERCGNILPLINNLADPSPGLGWRGRERVTLPERGRPELVLCLALIHHLVLGANLPLEELLQWFASLGANLVIEFVSKTDPMSQALLRNKPDIFSEYTRENFESWLATGFRIERREELESGTRTLYYATQLK